MAHIFSYSHILIFSWWSAFAKTPVPGGCRSWLASASDRNQQTDAHDERLFVALAEGVGVAGFQKPAEFSIPRRPEHELGDDLGPDACFAAADGVHPHRTEARLKF